VIYDVDYVYIILPVCLPLTNTFKNNIFFLFKYVSSLFAL
jgi:hypothetical protein